MAKKCIIQFSYYFNGNTSTVKDYLNPTIMDKFAHVSAEAKNLTFRPLWLSETATDYCSCAFNLTATFVGGFLWLDKLGLSAFNGMDVVNREDLQISSFGLLNSIGGTTPDYWLTFLHKKLVGNQVYGVFLEPSDSNLRLYASSSRKYV